jgi:hypothetical protein
MNPPDWGARWRDEHTWNSDVRGQGVDRRGGSLGLSIGSGTPKFRRSELQQSLTVPQSTMA